MAQEIFERKEVRLSQDIRNGKVKETKITIPAEFVKTLKINPNKHKIEWLLMKSDEGLFLTATLFEYAKKKD